MLVSIALSKAHADFKQILLFAITTPTYVLLLCSRVTGDDLSFYDKTFSKLIFVFVIVEYFADGQQWNFHAAKEEYKKTAKVPKDYNYTREQLDRGFNTSGLWAWSRHPNFAAEQAVWVALYQWGCSQSDVLFNWTGLAAMSYLILFQASTWLTEMLSAQKYADYKVYRQRVGRFLPKVATQSMDADAVDNKSKGQEAQGNQKKNAKAVGSTRRR